MKKILTAIVLAATMFGCTTKNPDQPKPEFDLVEKAKAGLVERIDMGDGTILDVVPVSVAGKAISAADPKAGAAFNLVTTKLAEKRRIEKGPFPGLDYTVQRFVLLKTGRVIREEEIQYIGETYVPIAPEAFTVVLEPANFKTRPVGPATNVVVVTPPAGPVIVNPAPTNSPPEPRPEPIPTPVVEDNGGFDPAFEEAVFK